MPPTPSNRSSIHLSLSTVPTRSCAWMSESSFNELYRSVLSLRFLTESQTRDTTIPPTLVGFADDVGGDALVGVLRTPSSLRFATRRASPASPLGRTSCSRTTQGEESAKRESEAREEWSLAP